MKKLLLIFIFVLLIGCSNKTTTNLSSQDILSIINQEVVFKNAVQENLKEQNIAEKYGISPNDIENGVAYYSTDEDTSDKIVIVKATSKDTVENVERALSSEIISISDSWKDNDSEMDKIENHIFKTKDIYVIMAISTETKTIESIFDSCFK